MPRPLWLFTAVLVALMALPAVAHAGFYVRARIETPDKTVYRGNAWMGRNYIEDSDGVHSITQNVAMSTIDDAARRAGFPYSVSMTAWGLSVESIDGLAFEASPPWPGWMYRVNGEMPLVGAADCLLRPGDDVLWYYGTYDTTPAAVRVARRAAVNTTVTVSALEIDVSGQAGAPIPDATVCVGPRIATTDASGQAQFKISRPGAYGVRVEKDGYVRSDLSYVNVAYRSYVSFYTRPARVRRGGVVTLIGALRSQNGVLSGRRVAIQMKSGSAWRTVRTPVANRRGVFSTWLRPSRTAYYRAVWSGDGSHLSVASAVRRVAVVR